MEWSGAGVPAPASLFAFSDGLSEFIRAMCCPEVHDAVFSEIAEFFDEFTARQDIAVGVELKFEKAGEAAICFFLFVWFEEEIGYFFVVHVVEEGVFFYERVEVCAEFLFVSNAKVECVVGGDEEAG